MKKRKLNIALLCGGRSAEREVSLRGSREIKKALDPNRYQVTVYDTASDILKLVKEAAEIDIAFILLHGKWGEDGTVQGMLELLNIPYQGSGVLGSALAMDKHLTKIIYKEAGIPTGKWILLKDIQELDLKQAEKVLGYPVMVKPNAQGSSVGIKKAETPAQLQNAVQEAFKWDTMVLIEEFIKGRELTGGILGLEELLPLPIIEIIPGKKFIFFDYEAKYKEGASREICPAHITKEETARAQDIALKAHKALHLSGYSRTDMILADTGDIMAIETNTIPGMTPTSLFPQAAAAAGIPFSDLLEKLIEMALEAHKRS